MTGIAILGAARTPIGVAGGHLSPVSASDLGAIAIAAALDRAGLPPARVTDLVLGCGLPVDAGAVREVGVRSGIAGDSLRQQGCDFGLQALRLACERLAAQGGYVVAGEMASGSTALGNRTAVPGQGLADAGCAEFCCQTRAGAARVVDLDVSRDDEDAFVRGSCLRALDAETSGRFNGEIVPVTVRARQGPYIVTADEWPRRTAPLRRSACPADGAGAQAAPTLDWDGAAALVLSRRTDARSLRIRAHLSGFFGQTRAPGESPPAPISAITGLLIALGWGVGDVDLWEIDEFCAKLPLQAQAWLDLPRDRLNVHGGAAALGRPGGAAGIRLLVTLLHALEDRDLARGVVAVCGARGEGLALAIERP